MNIKKTWILLLILFIWYTFWYFSYTFSQTEPVNTGESIRVLQSKKIQEAYSFIEKYYYGYNEITETEKEDALIDALAKSLWDKHTSYLNPKDAKEFTESLSWDFDWIGAVIQEHPKGIQIMKILNNSPAKMNGLMKWDIVTQINETSTDKMTANDAVWLIRWPKWTTVTLKVLSWGNEKLVTIQRDTVVVPSVDSEVLTWTTIWYIEIGFFWENTIKEFTQEFKSLEWSGVTGIIIDGRNNGGGYLDSAVGIVSWLIPNNSLVVATRGIRPHENMDYYTNKQKIYNTKIPIIMIVNNMSASATEILAWALQDYDRAIVIWEKTYWKWSVQEPFRLSDGSMMKITVAKWFTPKDRGIDEAWIIPDILVTITDDDYKNIYDRQLEWAKVIIQDFIKRNTTIKEYKNNEDILNAILTESGIVE